MIIDGWKNYLGNDKASNELARKRAEICLSCKDENGNDMLVKGKFTSIMPDNQVKEIEGLKCKECGCPASTATRSINYQCPLKKW